MISHRPWTFNIFLRGMWTILTDCYFQSCHRTACILQRYILQAVWWCVEYQLSIMQNRLSKPFLLTRFVNSVNKSDSYQNKNVFLLIKFLNQASNMFLICEDKYLPIGSNVNTILKIVVTWFEKSWSVPVIAKEYAASYTTTFRCLYSTFLWP